MKIEFDEMKDHKTREDGTEASLVHRSVFFSGVAKKSQGRVATVSRCPLPISDVMYSTHHISGV